MIASPAFIVQFVSHDPELLIWNNPLVAATLVGALIPVIVTILELIDELNSWFVTLVNVKSSGVVSVGSRILKVENLFVVKVH